MDYDSSTLIELKTMCKERGLRVSGSKAEVVIRLMEDDESKLPSPVSVSSQSQNPVSQIHHTQPVTNIYINNNSDMTLQITGIGIILYGMFRIGMALLFSDWMPAESFIAMMIGLGFILGGVSTLQGYKQGLYLTLVVLAISGTLSILNNNEFSPISIGMGGEWPVWFSLFCSGSCMLIVAAPLLGAADPQFRDGAPNYMNNILNLAETASPIPFSNIGTSKTPATDTKVVINCSQCNAPMKVPVGYKGKLRCPTCKESFKIE
tara:strand:- start:979 stop:1767 length:789 start_codon:yes stop_codon:yes gene_type:complete